MYYSNKHYRENQGFTIVELLIVIILIAILAVISTASYRGIQNRAIRTAVMSDMANFHKKIEMAKIETNDGSYPQNPTAAMGITSTKDAYTLSQSNWYYCLLPDHSEYLLSVMDSRGKAYFLRMGGTVEEGGNFDGATRFWKLGGINGTGCPANGYTWNPTTSTGTWASWVR